MSRIDGTEMNRPGLVTRRPNQASLSSRRRRALLRVILLPLDIVESADPVPVPAVDEVEPFLPARISAPLRHRGRWTARTVAGVPAHRRSQQSAGYLRPRTRWTART